jgi:hypothetical protein
VTIGRMLYFMLDIDDFDNYYYQFLLPRMYRVILNCLPDEFSENFFFENTCIIYLILLCLFFICRRKGWEVITRLSTYQIIYKRNNSSVMEILIMSSNIISPTRPHTTCSTYPIRFLHIRFSLVDNHSISLRTMVLLMMILL